MNCQLCGEDPETIALLPIRQGHAFQVLGCIPCARKYGVWCEKHQIPHLGFEDERTACRKCVDELAASIVAEMGEELGDFLQELHRTLPRNDRAELDEWLDVFTAVQTPEECLAQVMAITALKMKMTPDEAMTAVRQKKPADLVRRALTSSQAG